MKNRFFIFSLLGCFLIQLLLLDKTLTTQAQLWAETGTNFLFFAQQKGFWESLQILDYGYLPLLQRLWGHAVYALLPLSFIPYGFQFFALAYISFCCATPCLGCFSSLFTSKWQPFFISLLLCCNLEYELHTFVNFPYWAMIPIFMICALFISKATSIPTYLGLFVILAILSKATFVVLIPFWIVFLAFKKSKSRLQFIWVSLFLFFSALQLAICLASRSQIPAAPDSIFSMNFITTVLLNLLAIPYSFFARGLVSTHSSWLNLFLVLIFAALTFILLKKYYFKAKIEALWLFALLGSTLFSSAVLSVRTYAQSFQHDFVNITNDFGYLSSRTWIIPFTFFFLAMILVLLRLLESQNFWKKFSRVWLKNLILFFILFKVNNVYHQFSPQVSGYSAANWKRDKNEFLKMEYCIQLNPEQFRMGTSCQRGN